MRSLPLVLCSIIATTGSASASSAQSQSRLDALEAKVYGAMEPMFKPGDQVANWDQIGADLIDELARAPGGSSANAVIATDKDGERTVHLYGVALIPRLFRPHGR